MTSLWEQLPAALQADHSLDSLLDLLSDIDGQTGAPTAAADNDGRAVQRRTGHVTASTITGLTFDPLSGQFSHSGSSGAASPVSPTSWLTFPDLALDWVVDEYDPQPATEVALYLTLPSAVLTLPGLRGALLDTNQLPQPDPAHPTVHLTLPRLTVKVHWTGTGQTETKLVSASTVPGSTGTENVYQLVRMDPTHALVGPGTIVGFGFDSAELFLDHDPPGLPATAKGDPSPWSGVHVPDAHIYVAPEGMEGIACAAGVHDLYVGFGKHSGVTGTFDALVVERGHAPTISLSFVAADGSTTRIDDAATPASVPAGAGHLVVLLSGGVAPYTTSVMVPGNPSVMSVDVATPVAVTVPDAGTVAISVDAGAGSPVQPAPTRHITLSASAPAGGGAGGGGGGGTGSVSVDDSRIRIVSSSDPTSVTVGLADTTIATATWTWDGGASTGATAVVPLAAGATSSITVTWSTAGTSDVDVFFRFDHPQLGEDGTDATGTTYPYSGAPDHTSTAEAVSDGDNAVWSTGGVPLKTVPDLVARLALLPAGTATVTGHASWDHYPNDDHEAYNDQLADRRARGAAHLLSAIANRTDLTFATTPVGPGDGYRDSLNSGGADPAHYWRATLPNVPLTGSTTIHATLTRGTPDGIPPPPPPSNRAAGPATPSWFRKLEVTLKLERSRFVELKILGEVDFYTATEHALASGSTPQHLPDRPNAMDGVTDMTLDITVDDAAATWSVDASFRAVEGDTDGLWTLQRPPSGDTTAIDIVGAYAALAPVLADVAPAGPSGGDVVPLVIATAATFLLGATHIMPVKQMTLHGVEAIVSGGPAGTQVALIVDVETKFGLSAGILTCDLDHPITTRYKAVGFALGWNSAGVDKLQPTFDATKGYTIDIPNGAIHAVSPLGDLLQVLGVNVSRDNPTYVETEIGLAADLGVVEVERAKVRVRIDALEAPTLTGLGASIDVGVVQGRGYVSVNPSNGEVAGSLDVTLADPLNLRVMAGLKIAHDPDTGALGVFVGMELDLPVPILLGSTGLGIYGFLGGVGVNMRRNENPADTIPALSWLQNQPMQNPIDPHGWVAAQGHWAFAVGALLGTADGGFILHLKGVLLLELPGPRLLLVMKADILSLPPGLQDPSQQATILAVVDIDIGAGTITIGLVVDYSILGLISIHIPVQGFFTFADPPEWFLDVGTYAAPATVKVFDVFSGSGYLMLHGDGITPYPPFPQLTTGGFTIAVGFHVDLIWGDEDIGLYLKVGAGFDAIISFAPFALAGKIVVGGELRLFIISIGANAELDVIVVPDGSGGVSLWVHGEVCGHVDFFFFSVEGCVSFELGSMPTVHHDPQPLVSGVRLVSRSPALVEGSGSDRSIDGVLANAQQQGTADPVPQSVPLDTIPVVDFDVTPITPPGFTVLGGAPNASNGAPAGGWVKRGSLWWRYTLTSVTLSGALGAGKTPATWWTRAATVDPAEGTRLALLSWLPTPTPAAVPYGDQLVTDVHERWGSVCEPAAPPAAVLWTFDGQPPGPSAKGWTLTGIAWPDPPGSTRSTVTPTTLGVHEPWRCGDAATDARRGIDPARVIAGLVPCALNRDPAQGVGVLPAQPSWLEVAADPTLAGVPLSGLRQALMRTPAPVLAFERLCPGAVLRSTFADSREPSNHRDGTDAKAVEKVWESLAFTPDPLIDAVRLDAGQGMGDVLVLVAVPRKLVEGQLVFRGLAADGTELARTALMASDLGLGHLPGEWSDPIGPWAAPVQYALEVLQQAIAGNGSRIGGYVLAVVKVDAPDGTTAVDIGWDGARLGFVEAPPFYVVGAQAVPASEQVRFSWDDATKTADRTALSTALTQEPDDHALFTPGTAYTVQVSWSAEWRDQAVAPAPADTGTVEAARTQSFTFTADGVTAAPDRLDPWVLSTTPGPGEAGVFCDDPTRIVFATSKVADLFAAYGDTLELRLRAASGNHPQPGGPRGTGGAISSVILDPVVQAAGALRVTTPWEQAVRLVVADAGLGCIAPGTRDSHSVVEIDYPLEPCTDYLIDVVRVGNGAEELVLRRAFTTGRFRSLADVAAAFTGTRVEHRALGPGGSAAALAMLTPVPPLPAAPAPPPPPATPTGDAVDAAFAAAGLDRPSVPRLPRVQVVWSTDPTPQPLAVVVEAPEPLWRNHPAPALVDSDDPRSPGGKAWRDVPTNYLRLTRDASSTAAVTSFVAAPGLQRGIVLLPPGQRGTTLVLALARDAEPLVTGSTATSATIARIDLSAAPWEDPGPMTPIYDPHAFHATLAAIDWAAIGRARNQAVDARPAVQLRWLPSQQQGVPPTPFVVSTRLPTDKFGEAGTSVVAGDGFVASVLAEPYVTVEVDIDPDSPGTTVTLLGFAENPQLESLVAIASEPAPGPVTLRIRASGIRQFVVSGGTATAVRGESVRAALADDWTVIETVGLPVDDAWNGSSYALDKQGLTGSEQPPPDAALDRLRRGQAPIGWPGQTATARMVPPWQPPDPERFLRGPAAAMLAQARPLFDTGVEPWQQDAIRPIRAVTGPTSNGGTAKGKSTATVPLLGALLVTTGNEATAALALGFGTAYPVAQFANPTLVLSQRLPDFLVVAAYPDGTELAVVLPWSRQAARAPGPPTRLAVDRVGLLNPADDTAPWLETLRASFDRVPTSAALERPTVGALVRYDPADVAPAELAQPFDPDVDWWPPQLLAPRPSPHDGQVALTDPLGAALPIDLSPRERAHAVAVADVYGLWSAWSDGTSLGAAPPYPIPQVVAVHADATYAGSSTCPTALSTDLVVDWQTRTPSMIELRVALCPVAYPGAPLPAGVGPFGVPAGCTLLIESLTVSAPNLVPTSGAVAVAYLSADGTKTVPATDASTRSADGDTRRYRITVAGTTLDFAASDHWAVAMWARELTTVPAAPWGDVAAKPVVGYAGSPVPPVAVFMALPAVPLGSLPDADGLSHVHVSTAGVVGAAKVTVWSVAESRLRRAAEMTEQADRHDTLPQRYDALKNAYDGLPAATQRTVFTRYATYPAGTNGVDVTLPRGSRDITFYAVTAVNAAGVESAWPVSSAGLQAAAGPRTVAPTMPVVSAELAADGTTAAITLSARCALPIASFELYATRVAGAASDVASMGPPVLVVPVPPGTPDPVPRPPGALATVTVPAFPVAPDWRPLRLRAVAVAARTDDDTGTYGVRSVASPVAVIANPPAVAPDLSALTVHGWGSDDTGVRIEFTSALPPSVGTVAVEAMAAGTSVYTASAALPDLAVVDLAAVDVPGATPPAGAVTGVLVAGARSAGVTPYEAWFSRPSAGTALDVEVVLRDARGRVSVRHATVAAGAIDPPRITVLASRVAAPYLLATWTTDTPADDGTGPCVLTVSGSGGRIFRPPFALGVGGGRIPVRPPFPFPFPPPRVSVSASFPMTAIRDASSPLMPVGVDVVKTVSGAQTTYTAAVRVPAPGSMTLSIATPGGQVGTARIAF